MASQTDIDDDEIVLRANYVFGHLNPPVKCYSVDEIQPSHFIAIYQQLTGEEIPGSISMKTERAKLTICQFMINSLADDILELPLDHITSNGVIERDRRTLKDLLDVFIEMLEVSQSDLDNVSENTATTDNANEDIRVIPPRIREALKEMHCGVSQLVGKFSQLQSMSSVESQVQCTQTTPADLKSSSTSPVMWKKLLVDCKDEDLKSSKVYQHKIKKFSSSHPCQRATISRKALGSISNFSSVQTTTGKQKHVISTKLKKTSLVPIQHKHNMMRSSVKSTQLKSDKRNTVSDNILMSLSLVGELEKVRNRQREITRQIQQLQSEEQSLKTLESIMIKELNKDISLFNDGNV